MYRLESEARSYAERLFRTPVEREQNQVLAAIRRRDDFGEILMEACRINPFLAPKMEDLDALNTVAAPDALKDLIVRRTQAARAGVRNAVVFCMPKSGSSFVQSAIQHALQVPLVSLTGYGAVQLNSYYGINSREQELDELAVVKSILSNPNGFVAQHHTRCTMYLALQIKMFKLTPIVTVRNTLDCLVSFDRMMLEWRANKAADPWVGDSPFAIPPGYADLAEEDRLRLLSRTLGVWQINFFLSWKRCAKRNVISPVFLRYERDLLDGSRLVEMLGDALGLEDVQKERLSAYVDDPDKEKSRLRIGKAGLGAKRTPEDVKQFLRGYAEAFRQELSEDDIAYLTV